MIHTYVVLNVSPAAFEEIRTKLLMAGYDQALQNDNLIDMHGIALGLEERNDNVVETARIPTEDRPGDR